MEFSSVFQAILQRLRADDVEVALIGGLTLGVAGVARATLDMDFLVRRDDAPTAQRAMRALGYALRHETIEALLRTQRTGLDLKRIRRYFELFGRGEEYEQLRQRTMSDAA